MEPCSASTAQQAKHFTSSTVYAGVDITQHFTHTTWQGLRNVYLKMGCAWSTAIRHPFPASAHEACSPWEQLWH